MKKKTDLLLVTAISMCVVSGTIVTINHKLNGLTAFATNRGAGDVPFGNIIYNQNSLIAKTIEPNEYWITGKTEHNNPIYLHSINTLAHPNALAKICTQYHENDGVIFHSSIDDDSEFVFQNLLAVTLIISPQSSGGDNGVTIWTDYDSEHCVELPYNFDDLGDSDLEYSLTLDNATRLRITGSISYPHQFTVIKGLTITYSCSY